MKKKQRAKIVNGLIRGIWASLDSHLDHVGKKAPKPENGKFHRKCVGEYLDLIKEATKLY